MADQGKEVSIELTLDQIALDLGENDFKALVTEALKLAEKGFLGAFNDYKSKKAAVVVGVATIKEKGVGMTVHANF